MVDFMVAGYPKSGNNWMIHLLQYNLQGADYNPDDLNTTIHRTEKFENTRRKTVYMVRHPLDILLSYRNYEIITSKVRDKDFDRYLDTFYKYGGPPGYGNWNLHLRHWTDRSNTFVVKYDELDIPLLKEVYEFCNLPTEIAEEAYEAMSFENLKKNEQKKIDNEDFSYFKKNWQRPNIRALKEGRGFFNCGKSFYFKDRLTKDQIRRGYKAFESGIRQFWPEDPLLP